MVTLQAVNHHDTFELERVFVELCSLLEAVGLCLEGLFLNDDKSFDVSSLWLACAWRGIGVSIPCNRRAQVGKPKTTRRSILNSIITGWASSALMLCSIFSRSLLVSYEIFPQSLLVLYWVVFTSLLLRKTVITFQF